MTQELDWNQYNQRRPQKFFEVDNVEILLIVFRLLTM